MHVRYPRSRTKITAQSCRDGLHLPDPSSILVDDSTERARCRFCNCDLMRKANGLRWRFSGQMGAT